MIQSNSDGIVAPREVIKALLAFAVTKKQKDRVAMNGIGIDNGSLAATNGHCAVVFSVPVDQKYNQRIWPRDYCETQMKVAIALKKDVELRWESLLSASIPFPSISKVMPEPGVSPVEPVGLNADFLQKLPLACAACSTTTVVVTSWKTSDAVVGMSVKGVELSAEIIAMPVRL